MALMSAQRVEFIIGELLKHLMEFDEDVYGIATEAFLDNAPSAQQLRRQTLGQIFKHLKLNPKLVEMDQLNEYLKNSKIGKEIFNIL